MPEKPRINSLHRYRKRSNELVLEAHTHCELPLGCGGGVLRWRHARHDVPVQVFAKAERAVFSCWIDGVSYRGTRAMLRAGSHVLALRCSEIVGNTQLCVCVKFLDERADVKQKTRAVLLSMNEQTAWMATRAEPPAEWTASGFACADWSRLEQTQPPPVREDDYFMQPFFEDGVSWVAAPMGSGPLWIRVEFALPLLYENGTPVASVAPVKNVEESKGSFFSALKNRLFGNTGENDE